MSKLDLVKGWSCDERNRTACRNPHGCHCREITALRTTVEPEPPAATKHATGRYKFPYNRTFQAIAAAIAAETSAYAEGVGVNVSVKAFQEAFNSFPDARPLSEPQEVPETDLVCPLCGAPDDALACDNLKCPGIAVPRSSLLPRPK